MIWTSNLLTIILRFTLAVSLTSLAIAYAAQYAIGLEPCHLCLIQRVPFALVIALSLLGLWKPRYQAGLISLIAVVFLTNSLIATYHVAVEKHLVAGPSTCTTGEAAPNQSVDDFLKRIQNAPVVACDQPQWEFHGITMAGLNMVWSLFLAGFTFSALQQFLKRGDGNA